MLRRLFLALAASEAVSEPGAQSEVAWPKMEKNTPGCLTCE